MKKEENGEVTENEDGIWKEKALIMLSGHRWKGRKEQGTAVPHQIILLHARLQWLRKKYENRQ
jgi:hypothetical protein